MVKPGCPVADMSEMINAHLKRDYTECTSWRRAKLRAILALHPDFVVLSSYDHYIRADGEGPSWNVTPGVGRRTSPDLPTSPDGNPLIAD